MALFKLWSLFFFFLISFISDNSQWHVHCTSVMCLDTGKDHLDLMHILIIEQNTQTRINDTLHCLSIVFIWSHCRKKNTGYLYKDVWSKMSTYQMTHPNSRGLHQAWMITSEYTLWSSGPTWGRFKGGECHPVFFCGKRGAPPYFCRDRVSDCVWVPRRHRFSSLKVFAPPLKTPGSAPVHDHIIGDSNHTLVPLSLL